MTQGCAAHSHMTLNVADPTRTVTLRNAFSADATRRLRALQPVIRVSVVDRNVLGLAGPVVLAVDDIRPADPVRFVFKRDPEKAQEFMTWLREQEQLGILEIVPGTTIAGQEPWSNFYIQSSYQKGLQKARIDLARKGVDIPTGIFAGPGGVVGAFNTPFHQERVRLIYTRTFSELTGITAAMDGQISNVLASGMIEGVSPTEMARRINDRVSKVGITRARMIARTEVVQAFNEAAVGEFTRAEAVIGEPVLVQWITAEDERVRSSHAARHNRIFTQEEFLSLIGEPNCRCTGVPYIESIDGEISSTPAPTSTAPKPKKKKAPPPPTVLPTATRAAGRRISSRTSAKKADEISKQWIAGMSEAEAAAVESYTLEGYRDLNRTLRKGTKLRGEKRILAEGIDSALDSGVNFTGTSYRGLSFDNMDDATKFANDMKKNRIITDRGYGSTSTELKTATEFLNEADDPVLQAVFEIQGENGKWLNGASGWEKEKEVLFRRDTSFRVVDGFVDESGDVPIFRVKLEEV